MSIYILKLRGVMCIALTWTLFWILMFIVLLSALLTLHPNQVGPDEEPIRIVAIIGWVGFVTGGLFGILLSFAENGKRIAGLSLARATTWGVLASAVFPLFSGRADQVFWMCPFGALVAMVLIASARKAEHRVLKQPMRVRDAFFSFVRISVSDAIGTSSKTATLNGDS